MLVKKRAGLCKELMSLGQSCRSVLKTAGPTCVFEFAEGDRDSGHAAVGAGAGAVVGYQLDLNVIAQSHRSVQFVKVLVHLVQIQIHSLLKLYRLVSHHFVDSLNVDQRRSRNSGLTW